MKLAIVIPVRYNSGRLPGKPLISIAGKTMLERVWRIAKAVTGVDSVIVATDDKRIFDLATSIGAEVVMTPTSCRNGSERVFAAIDALGYELDAVINFQGDAPLVPPAIIQELANVLHTSSAAVVTPAVQLTVGQVAKMTADKSGQQTGRTGTCVVFDVNGDALYFSRSIIPAVRNWPDQTSDPVLSPVYQHLGIYGYTRQALADYLTLPESHLEKIEGLEQLRLLEHGRKIRVVPVVLAGRTHWSVDNPSDVAIVESIIAKEGELL